MLTCKDCIHFEVCDEYHKGYWGSAAITPTNIDQTETDNCPHFKDRSKFIELPCKVGDIVYFIKKGKIIKDSVRDINYISAWKGFEFNTLVDKWYEENIGHKIYFTLEEAKQALKKKTQKKALKGQSDD